MNTLQLIHNWHTKAAKEEDCFSRYIFEYLAFIAYLKRVKFNDRGNDRQAIQRLKGDDDVRDEYLALHLEDSWAPIITELNSRMLDNVNRGEDVKHWNCSHNNPQLKTDTDNKKNVGVIHDYADWENMIEFLYIIRNNLFHGDKDPERNRDKLFVEHGYNVLNPLVNIFLTDNCD